MWQWDKLLKTDHGIGVPIYKRKGDKCECKKYKDKSSEYTNQSVGEGADGKGE